MSLVIACGETASTTTTTQETTTTLAATTTTEAPTTTTAPEPTTTLDPAEAEWQAIPVYTGGPAGDYRTNAFGVPFTFTTPAEWSRSCAEAESLLDFGPNSQFSSAGVLMMLLGHATVEETIAFLGEGLDAAPVVTDTEVGGLPASQVELTYTKTEPMLLVETPAQCGYGMFPDEMWRFWITDVGGTIVTAGLFVSAGMDLETWSGDSAQPLIDSIQWKEAG